MYANIKHLENENLSSELKFEEFGHDQVMVMGAAINDSDWSYKIVDNAIYVSYSLPNGTERTIAWEPASGTGLDQNDREACAKYAHDLILNDDPNDWDDETRRLHGM